MNAERIDVLEVIQNLRGKAGWSLSDSEYMDFLLAKGAVSELIEALQCALPTVEHMYHTSPDPDGSLWVDVVRRRNALARVGGDA